MGRRTLLLIASILVAAVGTALIGLYVRDADSRARRNQSLVSVLVADRQIDPATPVNTLSAGSFRSERMLRTSSRPDGYLTLAQFTAAERNRATRITILPGQQIVPAMFAAADAAGQTDLKPGRRGLAIELTDPARAAGLLTPGSEVTVYSIPNQGKVDELLTSALVLRIGNQRQGTGTSSTAATGTAKDDVPRAIVTLDLSRLEALKVVDAQAKGELYFSVNGKGS